jgi:adenylate cyclase
VRFLPNVSYGTERYPEKVARRLRLVNIVSWCAAAIVSQFGVRRAIEYGLQKQAMIAFVVALCFASIPLLHRFGSTVALIALTTLAYLDTFRVAWQFGTGGGYWLAYFAGTAFIVLMLNAEQYILGLVLAVISASLVITLHLLIPYNTGELPPEKLFATLLTNIIYYAILLYGVVFYGARQVARAEQAAEDERARSDALLANILPVSIAERLKSNSGKIADRYEEASVLFADMAGFTVRAGSLDPAELVEFLDRVFSEFDLLVEAHGLEKIKTTGDAYMVVSGVPLPRTDHAEVLAALALDMLLAAKKFDGGVPIRIGIASGPLVAGIVGSKKFFYDVWGDVVNVASRMEAAGEVGRIQVERETANRLENTYLLEPRGTVDIKGKGPMETWYIVERRPVETKI